MIESWDDVGSFFWYLFQLFILIAIVGVCGLIALGVIGSVINAVYPEKPYVFEYPAPLDVCAGMKVNATMRDTVITVDYVNVRGDTVYLIYNAQRGGKAVFQSQDVLNGDDCPS